MIVTNIHNTYNQANRNRISYVDLGAGIMILWMIIYHALNKHFALELHGLWNVSDVAQLPLGVHAYINSDNKLRQINPAVFFPYLHFFMPYFFYKSGQFFKKQSSKELIKKDTSKLLRPFAVWSLIGYLFFLMFCILEGTFTIHNVVYRVIKVFWLEGYVQLLTPLWFLLSLFMVRQMANIILPKQGERTYWLKIFGAVLACYVLGYVFYRSEFRCMPEWVANSVVGLAFFVMGYSLSQYETKWYIWVPCLIGYICCCVFGFSVVAMKSNNLLCGYYLLNMPECLMGIAIFNMICRNISEFLPRISRPLEFVGQFAMIIFVSHGLLYIPIFKIMNVYELTSIMPYYFWITIGSYILILPIICYIYKFIPSLAFQRKVSSGE